MFKQASRWQSGTDEPTQAKAVQSAVIVKELALTEDAKDVETVLPIAGPPSDVEDASASSEQASSVQDDGGEWFMQGKKGVVHVVMARTRAENPIPWCRCNSGAFDRAPYAQGYMSERSAASGGSGMHAGCLLAMPDADERAKWQLWFEGDDLV